MQAHPIPDPAVCPPPPQLADEFRQQLQAFLAPLLQQLDAQIDARLVRTFRATVEAVLQFRHRAHGLLLSELGAYLGPPDQAPAGTKRLSNLLRSGKWESALLAQYLWQQANERCQPGAAAGTAVMAIWDDSVLEKPESRKAEGLCPVRSSKAARLARWRQGFSGPPPARPCYVPGLRWLALLLLGDEGPVTVAAMQWWSSRLPHTIGRRVGQEALSDTHQVRVRLLHRCVHDWGSGLLHLFDRGFAGAPWLIELLTLKVRFVLRWPKGYHLVDRHGQKRAAGEIVRGQRAWEHQELEDRRRGQRCKVGVLAVRVSHPDHSAPLWLVVARGVKKDQPWYLLTAEPIQSAADAWRIVRAYAKRWRIELTFRYGKSELALESPRLWTWERRLKLLLLVTVAYAFLLSLLSPRLELWRRELLRRFCHRTGRWAQATPAPLYRLRTALSRLWSAHPALSPARTPG